MNDKILVFIVLALMFLIFISNGLVFYDKKMLNIILVVYLVYILLHNIPNFEYYNVNYNEE